MPKIFRIYASHGRSNYAEQELPASDYEMLDLTERLRLTPGQLPYMELLNGAETFDYLFEHFTDQTDIYQLNILARQLDKLDAKGSAAFEGMVGMELEKKSGSIPLPRLIDLACNTDCCHVVDDVMTDFQLGKFLVDNGFIEGTDGLPDSMAALLDFAKIGREHRETEGGVFTGFGYVERHDEVRRVSETMDFQPKAPSYTVLLNMAARPMAAEGKPEMVQLRLPAPEHQIQETMDRLGARGRDDLVISILDCSIPYLNHNLYLNGELPQIIELAERLSELDGRGELTKFKAILDRNGWPDLEQILPLVDEMAGCFFEPQTSSPEDVARDELKVILCESDAETLLPHIDLTGYGRALLERDHARITSYGLLEQKPHEQVQTMERMVMT